MHFIHWFIQSNQSTDLFIQLNQLMRGPVRESLRLTGLCRVKRCSWFIQHRCQGKLYTFIFICSYIYWLPCMDYFDSSLFRQLNSWNIQSRSSLSEHPQLICRTPETKTYCSNTPGTRRRGTSALRIRQVAPRSVRSTRYFWFSEHVRGVVTLWVFEIAMYII